MSNLPFPEKILHQHIATLGKTGSGKSSALRVIAEHLLDKKRRVAIVDPKGDWWGLKSSADGKSAGYPNGRAVAQPENIPASSEEMLSRASRVLGGSEARLLILLHARRAEMPKTELAQESGFSPNSGGFNNYLGHMRTLGFVEYPAPGQVKAADWLYL